MTAKVYKTEQGIQKKLRHVSSRTYTIGGVLAFAAIGTILLVSSKAATLTANFEAEVGTRTGNASLASDTGASGGSSVKFSTASSGTTCVAIRDMPGSPDPWGGCWPGSGWNVATVGGSPVLYITPQPGKTPVLLV